MKKTLGS